MAHAKAFRTKVIPLTLCESFAACIRRNPRFTSVEVRPSTAKAGYGYVAYLPFLSDVPLSPEEESRRTRAEQEGSDYIWLGEYVFNPYSGKHYRVTELGCSCSDYRFRCAELGIDCKHMIVARKRGLITRTLAQRVSEAKEGKRKA